MKYRYVLMLMLLMAMRQANAQYNVQIEINSAPSLHQQDGVFIAGSFNGWKPAEEQYRFHADGNKLVLKINSMPAGSYEFKFTRGGWASVEINADGSDIANRSISIHSDTLLRYAIAGWHDDLPEAKPAHTASRHVQMLDSAFFIPQLNRYRKIWMYLPEGYSTAKKHYPVLYMQDGQSVFDQFTSAFNNEWSVDECLDSMIANGARPCIVVAVENDGNTRMNEYNPYPFTMVSRKDSTKSQTFAPEGKQYAAFLATTLKPYIDKHFRTLPDKENTMIGGSSMGGLITMYTVLQYPDVFGKAGIFSPSFWTAPSMMNLADSLGSRVSSKLFFYAGEKEGGATFVNNMTGIAEKLGGLSDAMIYVLIDPQGEHNEDYWRKWFGECYRWLMADGFNIHVKTE